MNKFKLIIFLICTFSLLGLSYAQNQPGRGFNPDSLIEITVSGTVTIDSVGMMNAMYYINEDNDTIPDYHLIFGPHWYKPDSGNAVRPNNGDSITIRGGLADTTNAIGMHSIVVYEINGEFWRDPYNPFWHIKRGIRNPNKGCKGFAYGHIPDSVQNISISGLTLVDTTFHFDQYFLDSDNDTIPDYLLNFGPPWYEPQSGIEKPNNGDSISVTGKLIEQDSVSSIIVFTLNDQLWRDSTHFDRQFGGRWMHRNQNDSLKFYAPFDSLDWVQMGPGWHGGGMHGGMMLPDSMFARIVEIFPGNVPETSGQNIFAAYEIGMFFPSGMNAMWVGGGCGRHLKIRNNAKFNLHFTDLQAAGFNININNIKVKYWDEQSSKWVEINNTILDPTNNSVTFNTSDIGNFIILTADEATNVDEISKTIPDKFELMQNYPNPFNPVTSIEFRLKENTHINLNIYNTLGEIVATLINRYMTAGTYSVTFNAANLPSGIYFYQLTAGGNTLVKKMQLLK